MKIACESCGAKYSIADEKVAGKVFKIRCKRCSEVIVVRGDQQGGAGAAAGGASAVAAGGEPIWHVVINGDQAGPYTPEQLSEMLSNGTVDWEAYVWAEGFDNWVPMREVEALVTQISAGAASAPAEQRMSMSYDAAPDAFAAQPSMGADPFADEPPTTAHAGYSAGSAEPDLFGGGRAQTASPFDGDHVHASSPSPRTGGGAAVAAAPAADAMTGARNENSVLFSLKNLQALATGSGGAPSMPAAAPGQERQGYAGGEGSGLIDIRALATATGMGDSDGKDAKDELLSIGNQGAFGALGSPMLAPANDDDGGGKKMLIWAGVAGVGLLSAAAVAVAFIMRPSAPTPGPGVGMGAPPAIVAPAVPAPNGEPEGAEPQSEGERAAQQAAAAAAAARGESSDGKGSSGEGKHRSKPSSGSNQASGTPEAKPPDVPEPKAPSKPSGPRTIDDLLDGALGGGGKATPKPAASAAPSNLPDGPSRDDVMSAMAGLKGAVSACGGTGVATVNVSVAGATGRVTQAEVSGITGPAGSCIAKAVRGATFPKFQQKVFKFKFPFKL